MKAGIYSVCFISNAGTYDGGVALFEGGRVHGGDLSYTFIGRYQMEGERITAEINVRHYQGPSQSIFAPLDEFTLNITGRITASELTGIGSIPSQPQMEITVTCRMIADALGS